MSKILIIGQAPPAVKQKVPYDSTLLYDWLKECGISKEQAQEMFEFDAVYNKFPGHAEGGGHKAPTIEQMDEHWPILEEKIQLANKIIVLGNSPRDYIATKDRTWSCTSEWLFIMHPSKMNFNRYNKNKQAVLEPLKKFLNK